MLTDQQLRSSIILGIFEIQLDNKECMAEFQVLSDGLDQS